MLQCGGTEKLASLSQMIRKCNVAYLTSKQARELEEILADLPAEKVQPLMDFAYYLQDMHFIPDVVR